MKRGNVLADPLAPNFGSIDFSSIASDEWKDVPLFSLGFEHKLDFSFDNGVTGSGSFNAGLKNFTISDLSQGLDVFEQKSEISAGLRLNKKLENGAAKLNAIYKFRGDVLSQDPNVQEHSLNFEVQIRR